MIPCISCNSPERLAPLWLPGRHVGPWNGILCPSDTRHSHLHHQLTVVPLSPRGCRPASNSPHRRLQQSTATVELQLLGDACNGKDTALCFVYDPSIGAPSGCQLGKTFDAGPACCFYNFQPPEYPVPAGVTYIYIAVGAPGDLAEPTTSNNVKEADPSGGPAEWYLFVSESCVLAVTSVQCSVRGWHYQFPAVPGCLWLKNVSPPPSASCRGFPRSSQRILSTQSL